MAVSVRQPVAQHLNEENASRDSVSIDVHKNARNDSRSRLKGERKKEDYGYKQIWWTVREESR